MSILVLADKRDEQLKRGYIKKLQELGITDPALLTQVSVCLTPETIAHCREDMRAIVYGEPKSSS